MRVLVVEDEERLAASLRRGSKPMGSPSTSPSTGSTKPFSHLVLVAHLRALMRRGARERPAVLAAGELRVDPAGRRCWRGDVEIALTARELSVLEFLVRRAGEVVSKREILDHVWDDDFEGDPNIIEVYVRYLRKKIDLPFGRQAIETVRGSGYRLAANGG